MAKKKQWVEGWGESPSQKNKTSGMADFRKLDEASTKQPIPKYTKPAVKRVPAALGIGVLEGLSDLSTKFAPPEDTFPGLVPVRQPFELFPQESEHMRQSAGLQDTLAENIAYSIGHETPAIIASYGAMGAATKIPAIGKALTGAGKWTETGRRGVAAGALYTPLAEDDPEFKDYLENMALFGVGDVAFMGAAHGIGKGIDAIRGARTAKRSAPRAEDMPDDLTDLLSKSEQPDYAPWVREDLIDSFAKERNQRIQQEMTRQRDFFEGMYEDPTSPMWPDYIPPQGIVPDFTAGARGVHRGAPQLELPGSARLALPPAKFPPNQTITLPEQPFSSILDELQPRVLEQVTPPMESEKSLVDFIHGYFGGQVSKNEIRRMSYDDMYELAQGISKERQGSMWETFKSEGEKAGYDIDKRYRLETDPEYRAEWERLREVSGLTNEPIQFKLSPASISKKVSELNTELGTKGAYVHAPEGFSNPEILAASKLAESVSGREIIPFKVNPRLKGKAEEIQGVQMGKEIYLNAETKQPMIYVTAHETVHKMQTTHPESYQQLMQIAAEHIQDVEGIAKHYINKFEYAAEDVPHELTADAVAECMMMPSFWQRIRAQAPELLKPILDAIDNIINTFKQKAGNDYTILPYLREVETMRDRMAEVYREYLQSAGGVDDLTRRMEPAAKTKADLSFKLSEKGSASPVDDVRAMIEYGSTQLRKGGYENWLKLMQKQFPDAFDKETSDKLMAYVWLRAKELNKTGQTSLKYGGEVFPITKQGSVKPEQIQPLRQQTDGLLEGIELNPKELKDISGRQLGWRDMWRNMRDVFGDKFEAVKARTLDPLEDAKATWVDHQRALTDDLYNTIVDGLGITKGSRESELIQLYGEGGYRHWEAAPEKVLKNEQAFNRWLAQMEKEYGQGNVEWAGDGVEINQPFDYDDLVREVGAERATDLVQAEKWFRQKYDELIDQVNVVRQQIYPGAEQKLAEINARMNQVRNDKTMFPDPNERSLELERLQAEYERAMRGRVVPKRQDYFRHFREMEGLEGIKNLFDTSAQISPELAGKSMYTRPKSKFHGFMQERGMGQYKPDAVGGFLEYVPSATYAIHIDPQGASFRQLENELVGVMGDNPGINTFLEYLKYYTDDIQGKTNFFDRSWQTLTDRRFFKGLVQLNNRIKGNVILGNAGTMVAQLGNIPQGLAFAKQYSQPGLTRYLSSAIERAKNPEAYAANNPMAESRFLKERFSGDIYRRFDTKALDKAKNFAVVGMEDVDRFATEYIWSACYEKALASKGIADPIRYADYHARRLVAGRGVGEVPLMQKSKVVQLIAPFQVEVGNLLHVIGDMRVDKDYTGAFIALPLSLWLFNRGTEKLRGSGVTIDPIEAIKEAIEIAMEKDGEDKTLRMFGRLAGEVLSNVPGGQTAAAMYPEYGFKVAGKDLPTRREFFGREDPTRYGSSVLVLKGLQDPLFKIAMPFGGLQAQKTIRGASAIEKGGSYTDKDRLRYPVDTDPLNAAKGLVFGPGAFRESRPYYESGGRPLSDKQTEQFRKETSNGRDANRSYEQIMQERRERADKRKKGAEKKSSTQGQKQWKEGW